MLLDGIESLCGFHVSQQTISNQNMASFFSEQIRIIRQANVVTRLLAPATIYIVDAHDFYL